MKKIPGMRKMEMINNLHNLLEDRETVP